MATGPGVAPLHCLTRPLWQSGNYVQDLSVFMDSKNFRKVLKSACSTAKCARQRWC